MPFAINYCYQYVVSSQGPFKTHLRPIVEPIHKARLLTLNIMAIVRQLFFGPLLHYHLHVLDAALKVGVKVSRQGRECDLVLFVGVFIHNPDRVSQYSFWRKELIHKG